MYVPLAPWLVGRYALIYLKLLTGCVALLFYNYLITVWVHIANALVVLVELCILLDNKSINLSGVAVLGWCFQRLFM